MKKPISTKVRVLFGVLAVILLVIACLMGFDAAEALGARSDDAPYFDPYDGTEQRQVLGFNLLLRHLHLGGESRLLLRHRQQRLWDLPLHRLHVQPAV